MIVNILVNTIALILGALFSWLPVVTTIPKIFGFDIDAALVTGIGQFNTVATYVWPLRDMFGAFLVLMTYYGVKIIVIFFLGHRVRH
jgi:hypothetical protein